MGAIIATPLSVLSVDKFPITPIANGLTPDEALAITCNLQFSPTVQAVLVDLSESARKFNLVPIQGAFLDMSNSAIDMRVDNSVTGQSILAKAGLQGYYNLLCPMPAKLIAVLATPPAGQLNITMILYNTVIESEVWGLTSGPAGPTGPQGPPGATGATGSQGPAGPAGVIASVQNQGTAVTPVRATLNFTGAGVTATDDSVNTRTNITIPGVPIASASVLGGVMTGVNVTISGSGQISVPPTASFQTPWLTSINGATNSLTNVNTISSNNHSYAGTTANPSVEQWQMNGLLRWRWSTVLPESGSNAGTNLQLQGYADDGSTIIDNPAISITRSSGFVGIGPGTPQYQLDVRTPGNTAAQVHIASTNTDAGGYLNSGGDSQLLVSAGTAWNGTTQIAKATSCSEMVLNNGGCLWYGNTGLTVGSTVNLALRMYLTATGQLGIGTASPTANLHVSTAGTSTNASTIVECDVTNSPYIEFKRGTNIWYAGSGLVAGPSDFQIYNQNLTAAAITVTNANNFVGIGIIPTHVLQLVVDDAAKPTTNTWTIASGAKVKRHVKRLKGGLDIINKLSPTEAEYNGKGGTPEGQRVVSLIAEEVREVLPHTVTEDADGNLGFNIHEVIHHLILSVQQLSAELERRKR